MNGKADLSTESRQWILELLDAMPIVLFVVDDGFRVLYINNAGREFLQASQDGVFMKQGGSVLRCLHAPREPGGCGNSEACKRCVIRKAVKEALRGKKVHRKQARLRMVAKGKETEVHYLLTAVPFWGDEKPVALLMLEDVSQLVRLESLLPICASCKKIRDENRQWHSIEQYLESHVEVEFTHGMCPECLQKWYPDEQ